MKKIRWWKKENAGIILTAALAAGMIEPGELVWALDRKAAQQEQTEFVQTQDEQGLDEDATGANSGKCGTNATYTISDGTLTISGVGELSNNTVSGTTSQLFGDNSQIRRIVIKSGITAIGQCDFMNFTNLTQVEIPSTVKKIGDIAFKGCTSLREITIPNSVSTIGFQCFMGCTGLTTINIPSSVTSMQKAVFYNCSALTTATIASKNSGEETFYGCTNLNRVTFEEGTQSINQNVFQKCDSLKSIKLSKTVSSISPSAFLDCPALSKIEVSSDSTNYKSDAGNLYKISNGEFSLQWCPPTITSLELNAATTAIGSSACRNRVTLKKVNLPNGIKEIGSYAFQDCTALNRISFPDTLTTIGQSAFQGCTELENVKLPDSITTMEMRVFSGCSGLKTVTLPKNLIQIYPAMFRNCTGLTEIKLPDQVTTIGDMAFYGCTALNHVQFSQNLGEVGKYAFFRCDGLKCISLPNSISKIWNSAFGFTGSSENSPSRSLDFKIFCFSGSKAEEYAKEYGLSYDSETTDHMHVFDVSKSGATLTYTCTYCQKTYKVTGNNNNNNNSNNTNGSYQNKKAAPGSNGLIYDSQGKTYIVYAPSRILLQTQKYVYNNKARKPGVIVRDVNGNDIAAEHYQVFYEKNKKVGKATVTVQFTGERYTGSMQASFEIVPKATVLTSLKASKTALTVKWKKTSSEISGYQIEYATNSKFSGAKKTLIKGTGIKQKKLKGLKSSKKYYVRIRAYKEVNGKKYYSAWSATKKKETV